MALGLLRLGVDVGGTFTDVVAIDASTRAVVARIKVPTTHDAATGVAAGIVTGICRLLSTYELSPDRIGFIAHSTTQATNALLEGDLAAVGVLGLLDGFAPLARIQMRFPPVQLAPGIAFTTMFAFAKAGDEAGVREKIQTLANAGASAIAVAQAFGVDHPACEDAAAGEARRQGLFATAGHEVSSMYGLRARTRTAALNAAILPKMVKTARMTASAVRDAGIACPLMVMRSDGGVMDVAEMERRPIVTMLSGPAAGVAGALLHEHVTDGIFVEVGGTSADCSAIRAGMPQMRPARVGGHRTMLRTLDVRTLAIAGGSMLRADRNTIAGVGPRSAHIAGLQYASFVEPAQFDGARVERIAPVPGDPQEYIAIVARDGTRIAITPTCAANALGYVPDDAFARGNPESALRAFTLLAADLGGSPLDHARHLLDLAAAILIEAIDELIADYRLDRRSIALVGGGGGAASLIPYAAQRAALEFRLARDAEVISPVGVALALLREVVERTIVDPAPADILRIRQAAQDAVIASGAAPESTEVAIEIDTQRNIVRATASGSLEMAESAMQQEASEDQMREAAAALLRTDAAQVRCMARTDLLAVFTDGRTIRVVDRFGVGRLGLQRCTAVQTTAARAPEDLRSLIEEETAFGDVGRAAPHVYVMHGARIADFSGVLAAAQIVALAEEELSGREPSSPVVIAAAARSAG